jgi:hypothetical protein
LTKHVHDVGSVAHQPTGCDKITVRIRRRYPSARRQNRKLAAAAGEKCVATEEEGIGAIAGKSGKGRIDLADCRGIEYLSFQSDGRRGFLHVPQCGLGGRSIGRIDKHGNTNGLGH